MKKIVIVMMVAIMVVMGGSAVVAHADEVEDYNVQLCKEATNGCVEVYDTEQLTYDILTNRNGKIIIERLVGIVLDEEGNGKLFNGDDYYNYINYANVNDFKVGDYIVTYCVYNPMTNYVDDVMFRMDYIIR